MLTEILKKRLEKQHYKIIGSRNAVKICEWTKKCCVARVAATS